MEGRWEDAPPALLRNVAKFERRVQDAITATVVTR